MIHIRESNWKIIIAIFVFLLLIAACSQKPPFDKENVKFVEVRKRLPDFDTKATTIHTSGDILILFDEHLNNSSDAWGKVFLKYILLVHYKNGMLDTVYVDNTSYRSTRTGTREMKKDVTSFLEQFFADSSQLFKHTPYEP